MEHERNLEVKLQIAEVELIYRTNVKATERPKISCSKDSYNYLKSVWDENKIEFVEQFKVLLLNRANRVLGVYQLSSGGISSTVVDIRLIFTAALKSNASAIIIAHNHPSGNLIPSQSDIVLTQKIFKAGKYLDILLFDHIILSKDAYYSFADESNL